MADHTHDEFKSEWVNHPYTNYLKREAVQARTTAVTNLISAAASSTDPRVLLAYGQYITADAKLKAFETGNK